MQAERRRAPQGGGRIGVLLRRGGEDANGQNAPACPAFQRQALKAAYLLPLEDLRAVMAGAEQPAAAGGAAGQKNARLPRRSRSGGQRPAGA